MSVRSTLLCLFLVSSAIHAETGPLPREVRLDSHGHLMPAGAIARLGTPSPKREYATDMAWSDDGKRILFAGWETIAIFDADTGRPIETRFVDRMSHWGMSLLSRDGRVLVRLADCQGWVNDVGSGQLCMTPALPCAKSATNERGPDIYSHTLSSNGRFLAGVCAKSEGLQWHGKEAPGSAWRFDLARGTQTQIGNRTDVLSVFLTADGRRAFLAIQADADLLICWDLCANRELWSVPLEGPRSIRAISRDGRRLALASDGKIQVFDTDRQKILFTAPYQHKWHDLRGSVAFAPDGRHLALVDLEGVVVRDVADGKIRHKFPHPASLISFAPDGRSLVTASSWIQRWDLTTGRPQYPEPRNGYFWLEPTRLQWSGNGTRLLACWADDNAPQGRPPVQGTLEAWDTASRSIVWRQPISTKPLAVAFDPAGSAVRSCMPNGRLLTWSFGSKTTETNIELARWPAENGTRSADKVSHSVDFFPDGRFVAIHLTNREMIADAYDPVGRHQQRTTEPYRNWNPDQPFLSHKWYPDLTPSSLHTPIPGHHGIVMGPKEPLADILARSGAPKAVTPKEQSPPQRVEETAYPRTDLGTGRPLPPLPDRMWDVDIWRQAPISGGSALFGFQMTEPNWSYRGQPDAIIWESLTGQYVTGLSFHLRSASSVVFSPDSRWVAGYSHNLQWITGQSGPGIILLDMRKETGRHYRDKREPGSVVIFRVPDVRRLAFSPDGRRLASAHSDDTILIWDVPLPVPAAWVLADADRHWADIGSSDASVAWKTLWHLLDHPDQAAELLKARFRPVPDGKDTPEQIARLDHPRYAVREAAARELAAREEAVEGEVRDALRKPASAEQQERLKLLVGKLDSMPRPTANTLRGMRSVWLLEHLHTPAARRILEEIAGGAPGSAITAEAKAVLGRLPKP